MFRFRRWSDSLFPIPLYEPKHLAEDSVLSSELLRQSRKAFKPLQKRGRASYPLTGTAAECSQWWANGKKDPKTALAIMAHFYICSVEQHDLSRGQNLELESKLQSHEHSLNLLNQKLHSLQEQNKNLREQDTQLREQRFADQQSSKHLRLQNASLNKEVQQLQDQNQCLQLKIMQQTEKVDHFRSQINFLNQISENLQEEKAQLTERLTASEEKSENLLTRILSLVQKQEEERLLNQEANSITTRRTPSENSSSSAVPVIVFINASRGSRFQVMIIQNAVEICQSFHISAERGLKMLLGAMRMQNGLMELKWKDECENCFRTGHTEDECRRPGGGAEVGPYDCYSCGMSGHWARNCWLYRN